MSTELERLGTSTYIALTTFRKDGTEVSTPVWLVREGDTLLVTTQGSSGKVKRIGNNPHVTVASCNSRGASKGPTVPASAVLTDSSEAARITALVAKKYGLLGRLLTRRGDTANRVGIILTLSKP